MALIIAGERSGVGKTTVTLAILAFLAQQQAKVQSFKVGPDYIDPMFHSLITGRPCRNLDPVLTSEDYVKACFAHHSQGVKYNLIEGVMGLFDGIPLTLPDYASTAHIARLLKIPVLLVLDCSRLSGSIAAIAQGYCNFDPQVKIAGLILNRVASPRHQALLENALEPLSIPILGILNRQDALTIPDRHLGLVPTDELTDLHRLFDQLATLAQTAFRWSTLLPLLADTHPSGSPPSVPPPLTPPLRIAIARDRAFNFYYPDNLDFLQQQGAELVFWSPLEDAHLPPHIQGLYLGGGFPEVFAPALAANHGLRHNLLQTLRQGLPTYAECGGLMYLCRSITNFAGESWPMVGLLPSDAQMGQRLTLGYRQITALQSTPLLTCGQSLWGHEFHRSQLTVSPQSPLLQSQSYHPNSPIMTEGWKMHQVHASYIHLHWGSHPELPQRFLTACRQYSP
ncbi:cobyrinate a,c-diamide synthase [Spirulina subsalsa FACHB-351]|uniref:Cobyrinate a,c-diamide synthase n=1 Tax=Spirulina subsalsa FACHB-351 TaxID=234711 RepID=A0ABT3LB83_9CYAN|nr:cobyrinate a,c-diamide synthase [Spirulina subsalsa]MCW6038776.1 cobyrinate a,c-diamide synthase [Spirulina subsalsa FACHB-351]